MLLFKFPSFYLPIQLILVSYLTKNLSSGKKLPKDEVIIAERKESSKFKSEWKSTLSSRTQTIVSSRSEGSQVIGHIWGPNVTKLGKWDKEWRYCPGDSFMQKLNISAIYPRNSTEDKYDYRGSGIFYVEVECFDFVTGKITDLVSTGYISLKNSGRYDVIKCPGVVNKINLKQWPDMGCQNDLGVVNIQLNCLGGDIVAFKTDDQGGERIQQQGYWSRDITCPPNSAICGVRSSTNYIQPQKANLCGAENVGIENMGFACCVVEDPAFLCFPKVTWHTRSDVKGYVKNKCIKADETNGYLCALLMKHGIEYSPKVRPTLVDAYEHLGYSTRPQVTTLKDNFQGTFPKEKPNNLTFFELFKDAPLQIEQSYVYIDDCDGGAIQELILECELDLPDGVTVDLYKFYPKVYRCQK